MSRAKAVWVNPRSRRSLRHELTCAATVFRENCEQGRQNYQEDEVAVCRSIAAAAAVHSNAVISAAAMPCNTMMIKSAIQPRSSYRHVDIVSRVIPSSAATNDDLGVGARVLSELQALLSLAVAATPPAEAMLQCS